MTTDTPQNAPDATAHRAVKLSDRSFGGGGLTDRPVARHYTWKEAAVVLVTFAVCGIVFDSSGLLTWANRLNIGPAQALWQRVLTPIDHELARAHLNRPREVLLATSDHWSARFGGSAEEAVQLAEDEVEAPMPTASPAPLTGEIDGPLGKLKVPEPRDEVELPGLEGDAPAAAASGSTEVTILLVGDSMMQVGLAPGIAAAYARDPHVRVIRETHVGTGLSRPDVYDWPATLSRTLTRQRPRFVVATFGGNDAQDIKVDGRFIAFGTERWDAAYVARVHDFLTELTRDGAEVLWIGLPPMRAEDFNERVGKLNDLVVQASRGMPRVEFLDATPLVTGDDHAFATYLPAPGGGLVQVRQEDGIHLSTAGGARVASSAVAWIASKALTAAGAADATSPAAPARLSDPPPGG